MVLDGDGGGAGVATNLQLHAVRAAVAEANNIASLTKMNLADLQDTDMGRCR